MRGDPGVDGIDGINVSGNLLIVLCACNATKMKAKVNSYSCVKFQTFRVVC